MVNSYWMRYLVKFLSLGWIQDCSKEDSKSQNVFRYLFDTPEAYLIFSSLADLPWSQVVFLGKVVNTQG